MASGVKKKKNNKNLHFEGKITILQLVQLYKLMVFLNYRGTKKMLYSFQATAVEHKQHCITVKDKQSMSKFYNS